MYEGDSFFTLSMGGRVGLALLSLALAAAILALTWHTTKERPLAWRLAIAAALFYLSVWLSPQIYYLYYQMIFDGLPWQIVVKPPPSPVHIAELLSFQYRPNLSAHSKGIFGWLLLAMAAFRPHLKFPRAGLS